MVDASQRHGILAYQIRQEINDTCVGAMATPGTYCCTGGIHMSTISVESAAKSFGPQSLFTDVSFSIADGEVVALIGRNGCGKSTLIRCIVGLDELDEGMVHTDGARPRRGLPARAHRDS